MEEILYLVHRVPYPPDRGDKIRSYHILRKLTSLAPVHLIAFADDEADARHAEALDGMVASRHVEIRAPSKWTAGLTSIVAREPLSLSLFASRQMQKAVDRVLRDRPIKTIFAFSSQMAQFVPIICGDRHFIMDFVDMDSAKFGAYAHRATGPMRYLYQREARLLARYEQQIAARADRALFVSQAEANLFCQTAKPMHPHHIAPLENGIDLDHFKPSADYQPLSTQYRGKGPLIVFTGQMDYWPNIEAVTYFVDDTLPRIRAVFSNCRFAIVGRKPSDAVKALANRPGVIVTGEVDDTRCWLAGAAVVVAPLRLARGIQNKVLEAMAMACPVVASPSAFEGIDAQAGTEIIVADGSVAEAAAIIDLMLNPAKGYLMGQAARARMEARYSWDAQLAPLEKLIGLKGEIGHG